MALAASVSSCGGGSGSCGKVAACGGDVVGSYTISGGCINNAALNMQIGSSSCAGISVSATGTTVTGSGSFNADMTYTVTETVTFAVNETVPPSCLTQNGVTLTCAQLDALLQQELAADPSTVASAHCSGSSTCTCAVKIGPQTKTETGTYTTSGTSITTTASDGTITTNQYCAQGGELHVMEVDMSMPMAVVQTDLVFKKR